MAIGEEHQSEQTEGRNWILDIINGFIDLIYPPNCAICSSVSSYEICPSCRNSLIPIGRETCIKCGNPKSRDDPCPYCLAIEFHFDMAVSVYAYEEPLRDALLDFKYHKSARKGRALARLLGESYKESILGKSQFDIIIPVPITQRKKKLRSYNQSEILANGMKKVSGIPVLPFVLERTRESPSQTGLDLQGRMKNVAASFSVVDDTLVRGKKILLIDDIITTGATVNECAKVLLEAGARRVVAFSLARGMLD